MYAPWRDVQYVGCKGQEGFLEEAAFLMRLGKRFSENEEIRVQQFRGERGPGLCMAPRG